MTGVRDRDEKVWFQGACHCNRNEHGPIEPAAGLGKETGEYGGKLEAER